MEITAPRFANETILKLLTPLVNGTDKVLQEETAFSLGKVDVDDHWRGLAF